jgi:WD40 repeat protein
MKQIGLIPSGCQQNDVASMYATDKYLFYASSVAIYVLNAQTYVVEKILNSTNRHIASFTVSPHDPNRLITVGTDGQVLLWDVEDVRLIYFDSFVKQSYYIIPFLMWFCRRISLPVCF